MKPRTKTAQSDVERKAVPRVRREALPDPSPVGVVTTGQRVERMLTPQQRVEPGRGCAKSTHALRIKCTVARSDICRTAG